MICEKLTQHRKGDSEPKGFDYELHSMCTPFGSSVLTLASQTQISEYVAMHAKYLAYTSIMLKYMGIALIFVGSTFEAVQSARSSCFPGVSCSSCSGSCSGATNFCSSHNCTGSECGLSCDCKDGTGVGECCCKT